MADAQLGNTHGYAAASTGSGQERTNLTGLADGDPQTAHVDADLNDISAMRTRLAAIDGTYYTAARLNNMTFNDMVYAIRLNDNSTTIKQ